MEPHLIPIAAESITSEIDYTLGLITRQYLQNGAKYYFTLHQEHYTEVDGHIPTGSYLAVIFSPKGLRTFYLIPDGDGNFKVDPEETDELPTQHAVINEHGQLEPVINVAGLDVPFSDEMRQELEEMNNMEAYLPLFNQAIKETNES